MRLVSAIVFRTLLVVCMSSQIGVLAQQTKVIPWQLPQGDSNESLAYRPEPVLFVHGVNANDKVWEETVMPALQAVFGKYQVSLAIDDFVSSQTNGLNAAQHPYLHTFNYGDRPGEQTTHDSHSFEHVQWNAWAIDRDFQSFTNEFVSPASIYRLQLGPHDGRQTLDERINGRVGVGAFPGIRQIYNPDPANTNNTPPQIVLVAHSNGGLVSHYYLVRASVPCLVPPCPGFGVRRLVTLATPHLGSHVANWLTWYNNADPDARARDGLRAGRYKATLARDLLTDVGTTTGFFLHGDRGAVWDFRMVDDRQTTPPPQRGWNRLIEFFRVNPAPKIEYVFNVYQRGAAHSEIGLISTAINQNPAMSDADNGDGVVPLESAAGKPDHETPSIWNGNIIDAHEIDPVIFGAWQNLNHIEAPHDTNSIIKSLLGVPYRWRSDFQPPIYSSCIPAYANSYDENQSFSKYLPVTESIGNVSHTDEPGVSDLKLLFRRPDKDLFVPALNTWGISNGLPAKITTNLTNFVGHQVIGLGSGGSVTIQATLGTKNHSQTPAQTCGTNYWIVDGNEYLPASLKLKAERSTAPIMDSNTGAFSLNVLNCLVRLDPFGNPRYQYALCNPFGWLDVAVATQNFVAVQARNIAGFVTPQAERAFDVPVDSATVVAILRKINQGEALSNACTNAIAITRWKATVSEWVKTDSGTITLNFFPVTVPPNARDAWTDVAYTNVNYAPTTKTFTLDPADAPSQLIVSNLVYLGCDQDFTTNYPGISGTFPVPHLVDNTLAGVPVDASWLSSIRASMEAVLSRFRNTTTNVCIGWTLTNILAAAGNNSGNWRVISNSLVTAQHFTELYNVAALLDVSNPATCCCAAVTITMDPNSTNACSLPDGVVLYPYNKTITASGGVPPLTFAVTSNSLPAGLTLTNIHPNSMSITGAPTALGSNTFTITVTDTNGCSTNAIYNLFVDCGPPYIKDVWQLKGIDAVTDLQGDRAQYYTIDRCYKCCPSNDWFCPGVEQNSFSFGYFTNEAVCADGYVIAPGDGWKDDGKYCAFSDFPHHYTYAYITIASCDDAKSAIQRFLDAAATNDCLSPFFFQQTLHPPVMFWHGAGPCDTNNITACDTSSTTNESGFVSTSYHIQDLTWTLISTITDNVNLAYICITNSLVLTNCMHGQTTYP